MKLRGILVWVARLAVGATFIISGWAKAIDPWGFIIKVNEYLAVWGMNVPEEAVLAGCVALAAIEFLTGILIAVGAMKRTAVAVAAAMMLVMLPLTLYILIADPVADCGCFGEFLIISNTATFLKNVVLSALIIYLLMRNTSVRGLYPAAIQWLVVIVSLAFPLFLSFAGYQVQPLVDFRPYKTGTGIFTGNSQATEEQYYIYEKDGVQSKFSLDELPDSTWTFVEAPEAETDNSFGGGIAVFDSDGFDVAEDIIEDGQQLFLIVPEPDMHYLIHAHYVERLYNYAQRTGVGFTAILGAQGVDMQQWADWTRPNFEVFTADATALKQLVRGTEALVYTDGGMIKWKRTLRSLPADLPDSVSATTLDTLPVADNGVAHTYAVLIYIASLFIIYVLGLSSKVIKIFTRIARHTTAQ